MVSRARGLVSALRAPQIVPSPNIWHWPAVYEAENRAQDADGAVWRALEPLADWTGDVVDVGCGSGFHLPRFAERARSVVGVEPHEPLVEQARARVAGVRCGPQPSVERSWDSGAAIRPSGTGLPVEVLVGSAQALPLADGSADVVHARTAYFFGAGCEPGLREADRVLRPGGALVVVDLDAARPPYGRWMRADLPSYDGAAVDAFFEAQGFTRRRVATVWRFPDRATLVSVLRIEFSAAVAARAAAEVDGLEFTVGYRVLVRRKPSGLIT
ncbi:class I SAM-dependent methyltransferase [Actinokineospora soli]